MPYWVIEGLIATSPRPGYTAGSEHTVAAETVDRWLSEVKEFGIKTVMCLLAEDQLWLYRMGLPQGLLGRYEEAGLHVAHIPTLDHLTHPFTEEQYARAWELFQQVPKPVLVHCSAGYDRTGRIVDHLLANLGDAAEE